MLCRCMIDFYFEEWWDLVLSCLSEADLTDDGLVADGVVNDKVFNIVKFINGTFTG